MNRLWVFLLLVTGLAMPTIYRWTQPVTVDSTEYAELISQRGYFSAPVSPTKISPLVAQDSYPATGPWTDLTLGTNIANYVTSGSLPGKVRLENHGSTARLMGRLMPSGGDYASGAVIATLPAGFTPLAQVYAVGRYEGTTTGTPRVTIEKNGQIKVGNALTVANANWASLDGITFPVKWHDEPHRLAPADLLSLENWYLTTPSSNGPQIYNLETGFYEANNFFVDPDGVSAVFSARADGGTTSGSSYPRCELREMNADGTNASWATNSGTHTLRGRVAITGAPPVKPQVVFAQIHDASQDIIELMYDGQKSPTALIIRYTGTQHAIIKQPYTLGTWINYKIVATGGVITVYIDGTLVDTINQVGSGNYFKAGAYVQSNLAQGDAGSARGTVKYRDVRVTHA